MKYVSVAKMAEKWGLSERSVRNYCANGRIADAKLIGKTWYIPENAQKPDRVNKKKNTPSLLQILRDQKATKMTGGIYHKIQIELTYNSNHIEGSRLTHDQTRYIFETNTIGITDEGVRVDDIIETSTHFRCIDEIIENYNIMTKLDFIFAKALFSKSYKGSEPEFNTKGIIHIKDANYGFFPDSHIITNR